MISICLSMFELLPGVLTGRAAKKNEKELSMDISSPKPNSDQVEVEVYRKTTKKKRNMHGLLKNTNYAHYIYQYVHHSTNS